MKVTFYQRFHGETEQNYIRDCLSSNLETDGFFMQKLLGVTKKLYPDSFALFTTSCTLALETVMGCLELNAGDEVLLPSFNFPSAANAVLRAGGRPVLCDIDPLTQNLSLEDVKNRISKRTKAVVAVHYGGVACPMEELNRLCREAGAVLIEDAAQGIGAFYQGIPLGTLGDYGTVSFHHTKNLTCGEGGLMLTRQEGAYHRAQQYRLHGTNRTMYLNGEADRYTWNMPGSCAALGEPAAALLLSQMESLDEITRIRTRIMEQYMEFLEPLERQGIGRRMVIPDYARPNGHIFYLRFEQPRQCRAVRERLAEEGIDCKSHYVPLHVSPMGQKLGYKPEDLPESYRCYQTLLRLPVHTGMNQEAAELVAGRIMELCSRKKGV